MALYFYQGFSKEGKRVKGQIDASSISQIKEQLSKRGIFISSIDLVSDITATMPWYKRLFQKKVTLKDKILFTKQLAVLLKSGIPLMQSLELLMDQFEGQMRSIIISLKDGIKEGQSLADGLKQYPKIFDNIYVQLVRAGEATGKLEVILVRLTTYMERRAEIQKKVRGALSYPMIQLGIVTLVVIFLLNFVVPRLVGIFKKQGSALPGPTQFMLSISDFLQNHYILLGIFFVLIISGFIYIRSQEWGKFYIDKIKLKLPLIKYFTRMSAVVQFSRTLGMLLESGVNLSEALDIVCKIINNRVLAATLIQAKDKIIKEGKITQYLKDTNIFPSIAIYLLRTGEQSGELAQMLLVVAENYEEELSELTDSLAAKIEPIMMIVMAVVVGFIVISIALPITQMGSIVGKK
jgi:type II secretory pathway component PulF